MPPVGFEPTISAGERPQTYALDRAATGTGTFWHYWRKTPKIPNQFRIRSLFLYIRNRANCFVAKIGTIH